MKDYYKILRISPNAQLDEIKHSFRILAHKFHTNKNDSETYSEEMSVEIKDAYDILTNPQNKAYYDIEYKKYYTTDSIDFEIGKTKNNTLNDQNITFIFDQLNKFRIENSDNITLLGLNESIESCRIRLGTIKINPKYDYSTFLDISSSVVRNYIELSEKMMYSNLNICVINPVEPFKSLPKHIGYESSLDWLGKITELVIKPLQNFEMNSTTKEQFSIKILYYNELRNDLFKGSTNKHTNKGCFLATMVYEDSNHLNVIILRYYRDAVIQKTLIGRLFIQTYYKTSPTLVKLLKNQPKINSIIKYLIGKIVNQIKNKIKVK